MSERAQRRRTKATWDWVRLDRGMLTRWTETVPDAALKHWLRLHDALTAEAHDYQSFPATDPRWRAWLGCRDMQHVRATLARLRDAGLLSMDGHHVGAIDAVDEVWREREAMSQQKRQNRAGKPPASDSGVAEDVGRKSSAGWKNFSNTLKNRATSPANQEGQQKQHSVATAVERSSLHPHPHHTESPFTPTNDIAGLVAHTAGAVAPVAMKGLGNEQLAATANPFEADPPMKPARPSGALLASGLVNRH